VTPLTAASLLERPLLWRWKLTVWTRSATPSPRLLGSPWTHPLYWHLLASLKLSYYP
jgi:hypothetical protein